MSFRGSTAVVGTGSTGYYKRGTSPLTSAQLILTAILRACEDAGAILAASTASSPTEATPVRAWPSARRWACARFVGPPKCGAAGAAVSPPLSTAPAAAVYRASG